MSIQSEITLLQNTKGEIRNAIMEKGVTVTSSDLFSTYPTRISQISMTPGDKDALFRSLIERTATSLVIPEGTEVIRYGAFNHYETLTSVTIPNTVTTICQSAFGGTKGITSIVIPNSVTTIEETAFSSSGLTSVTLPSSVTSIEGYTFSNCTSLASVTIPNSVTIIKQHAFENCTSLTSVNIPDSVESINRYAFAGCSSLASITVNATTPPSLASHALDDTNNCPIYVPEDSVDAYKSAWPDLASRIYAIQVPNALKWTSSDGTQEISIACEDLAEAGTLAQDDRRTADTGNLMETVEGSAEIGECVTTIGYSAFENCSLLTSIDIPDSVTNIESVAFYHCSSLTSVNIPDSVTAIGYSAFRGCSGLTSVTLPSSVTSIEDSTFYYCSSLTSVTIGSGVTSIGRNAFNECPSLASITVNATTPPTLDLTAFDGTNNCPIYVPEDSVETYKTAWRTYADRIQAIIVPNKMIITYGNGGIIETISIPEDHICDGEEESFPTTIRDCDFHELYASHLPSDYIKTITIGENVEIIELRLAGCIDLESITVQATTPPEIYDDVFNSAENNNCPIYVPADSLQVYLDDPNWGMYYSSRLQAIPEVKFFRKITDINDVTSGKYLIVDTQNYVALNASLIKNTTSGTTGINGANNSNCINVSISDGTITPDDYALNAAADYDADNKTLSWTDIEYERKYLIQWKSSTSYAYGNDRFNKLNNTIPKTVNGNITFNASGSTRSIGKHYSYDLFKFYAESNTSYYTSIALFKLM